MLFGLTSTQESIGRRAKTSLRAVLIDLDPAMLSSVAQRSRFVVSFAVTKAWSCAVLVTFLL